MMVVVVGGALILRNTNKQCPMKIIDTVLPHWKISIVQAGLTRLVGSEAA